MKTFFAILISLTISFSFAQAKLDGPFKDYYDSGELKVEGQYLNQKRTGDWKSYYKNGQISRLYSYKAGKRNKEYTSYYEDGILKSKTEKIGKDYINKGFYKSGELKYDRKVETGYYKGYYESGAIKVEATYLSNELFDDWKLYYENGQLKWLVSYKTGYRAGRYKHFYENGDLKLEGNNEKDKVDGEEKRYLPNSVLQWKGNYSKGILVKTWTKYDITGKKLEKVRFKNGVPTEAEFVDILRPTKVEDGVLERLPIYPGCENFLNNINRKKCMNLGVSQFIVKNFNTKRATNMGINGKQRIFVAFKINKKGEVINVSARAPHPILKQEAIRVIQMLPNVKPGEQRGKPVIIPFAIPIVFQVQ